MPKSAGHIHPLDRTSADVTSLEFALTGNYTNDDNGYVIFTIGGKSCFFVFPHEVTDKFMKLLRKFNVYIQRGKLEKVHVNFKTNHE